MTIAGLPTGEIGDDNLQGGDGNDAIIAGDGIDTLLGGNGNDSLTGGLGNDSMQGNAGIDTYTIAKADGQDYIYNYDNDGSADVVKFTNLAATAITAVFDSANDLVLQYGAGGQLTIENYFTADTNYRIDKLQFTDSIWTLKQIAPKHNGTANADTLYGFNGIVNFISGLGGNDIIYGGDLNDKLNGGDGGDVIYGYAGDDSLTGDTGDDNLQGGDGNDAIMAGDGIDTLLGGNGNDSLTGGLGNDSMQGNAGNDIYTITKTDGQDIIHNHDTDSSIDTVKFTNVASTDIKAVFDSGYNLVLQYGTSQLSVYYYFTSDKNYRVDKFQFTDKTWTLADIAPKHNGTANADTLYGFNDVVNIINGLGGNDTIYGGNLNDKLNGGDGGDLIYGYAGDDTLTGETGDDNLQGGDDNDAITAGDGSDTLVGGNGNDSLTGGLGNDSMQGNAGIDIYTITKADGQDIIYNHDSDGSVDTVKFTNVATTDIKAVFDSGYNLVLQYGTSQLSVYYYFTSDANYRIDKFQFTDKIWGLADFASKHNGTTTADSLYGFNGVSNTINGLAGNDAIYGGDLNDMLIGNDGDDNIQGGAGNDSLTGGLGNDYMQGNAGTDTYTIAKADGQDIIYNHDSDGSVDTVKFTNVATSDIKAVFDSGYNLVLQFGTSQLSVYYYFTLDANYRIDKFQFTDKTWGLADFASKHNGTTTADTLYGFNGITNTINGLAGSDVIYGGDNNDTLMGGDGNDVVYGNAGNDTLIGGQGNDTLQGDAGADIYSFTSDDGQDTINNYDTDNSVDIIKLTNVSLLDLTGIAFAPGSSNSLVLGYGTVGSQVTVTNYFYQPSYQINEVQLADGNKLKSFIIGTTANDVLNGTGVNDALSGQAGNDTLKGGNGDDLYFINDIGDKIIENLGAGIDTVLTSVNYTIADNVDNLALQTGAVTGTGNGINNRLLGNSAVNTLSGLGGNDWLDGGSKGDTMNGGAGNDTFIVDNLADNIVENFNEGTDTVQSSVTFTLAANVENLVLTKTIAINGTGNDLGNRLTGNAGINVLDGGAGNDFLDGDAGADTLKGGAGDDIFLIDATDIVEEGLNAGVDTVQAGFTYTLGSNLDNLLLIGAAAINGTGNGLANSLTGNSANNILNGGAGVDILKGKAGDDSYYIDVAGDVVEELSGEGTDTVYSTIDSTLIDNVEKLVLLGTAKKATGNALDNSLTGNASNNLLNGGVGVDTLAGGVGNDSYVVDNIGDTVIENAGAGTDTVESSVNYTLADNVENLTLTGVLALKGTGNNLANVMLGNSGNNSLNGAGGADTMEGGAGNDFYYVNDTADSVVELAGQGTDTVFSSAAFTLNDNIENLTLTGTMAIDGMGNSLDNRLVGNTAANKLNGAAGADSLKGGAGSDVFIFSSITGGTDTTLDCVSGTDKLQISGDIHIGNGDASINFGTSVGVGGTFTAQAELVIINANILGNIDRVVAATAIGNAQSAYTMGDTRLFVVDNNVDSILYQFTAKDANAQVSADELTLIGTLQATAQTVLADYLFA